MRVKKFWGLILIFALLLIAFDVNDAYAKTKRRRLRA